MSQSTIQHFQVDPERLAPIRECMEDYGVDDFEGEWPNNIISNKTVVYSSGVIAKEGEVVRHNVDPDELSLCQRLAKEVCTLMQGVEVGMGSESSDYFREFFMVANVDDLVPEQIDIGLIKTKFGGTIYPLAPITVEPLAETGTWWSEVAWDGSESEEYLRPWRTLIEWFITQKEFKDSAFVRIGECDYGSQREFNEEEAEIGSPGCVYPRFAVGLTHKGSLAGIFGFSVQT